MENRESGVLIQATTKEEVECAIMKENSARFRLAYTSPTLNDDMHGDLGPSREGNLAKDILNNQEQLRNRPEVQEIFDLFHSSQLNSISTHIITEQWIDHCKHAKERTESSYSGMHFGHYKVHTLMPEIAAIKCKLVNLAIMSGQPLLW